MNKNQNRVLSMLQNGNRLNPKAAGLGNVTPTINKLRAEGHVIYKNRNSAGINYRMGSPRKSVIATAFQNAGNSIFE